MFIIVFFCLSVLSVLCCIFFMRNKLYIIGISASRISNCKTWNTTSHASPTRQSLYIKKVARRRGCIRTNTPVASSGYRTDWLRSMQILQKNSQKFTPMSFMDHPVVGDCFSHLRCNSLLACCCVWQHYSQSRLLQYTSLKMTFFSTV